MKSRLAFAVHVLLTGVPKSQRAPRHSGPVGEMPPINPLVGPEGDEARRNAALSLMDDDVYGFLLVRVLKDFHGPMGEVKLATNLHESLWPAVTATLAKLVEARVHAIR